LLKLLLSEQPASPQAIADLAAVSDWTVPAQIAVIALEYREDQHRLPATSMGRDVLVDLESNQPCLLVADPEKHLRHLGEELHGRRAAVGPTVALTEAHRSLRYARQTIDLVQRGVLPRKTITWSKDHLSTLALLSDEFLVSQLTERVLAPFADLTVKQRERLASTLLAWLETQGAINDMAARLDVHPQTVRYRMHQIDQLLGARLYDPDERLTMEIALRAQRLLSSAEAEPSAKAV
jgi:DNA-binding PucR family transcriptional regulator